MKYVRELSKMEFIICKCANNDNNHDLFFSKDADDDFNLPYILYSDYLKYMNGEFDSTDDETKKYWDEKFKRYAGRISKENCKTHSVNAQWDMISGITDPEIEDMIIVVGAAQNTEIRQSPKAYWESAGLWDIYVEITHNGKLVASGSFDVETGEMGRNIYIYTPV